VTGVRVRGLLTSRIQRSLYKGMECEQEKGADRRGMTTRGKKGFSYSQGGHKTVSNPPTSKRRRIGEETLNDGGEEKD